MGLTSKHQQDWKQNATAIQNRKNAKACRFVSELSVGEKKYCHQKNKIGKYCRDLKHSSNGGIVYQIWHLSHFGLQITG